jgi:hypothetical protein
MQYLRQFQSAQIFSPLIQRNTDTLRVNSSVFLCISGKTPNGVAKVLTMLFVYSFNIR